MSGDTESAETDRVLIDTPGQSGFTAFNVKTWEVTSNGGTRFVMPEGESVTVSPTVDWILAGDEVMKHVE